MAKSRYADATKAARRAAMSAHKVTAAANAGNADASAQPSASAATEPARDARRDELTHVDAKGEVRMVDVSDKAETHRIAIAEGTILMHPETQAMVLQDRAKKGDVLACARVAGIMAIKRTSDIIPMCHPLLITKSKCDIAPIAAAGTPAEVMATEGSVTADYLSGRRRIAVPETRRKPGRGTLKMTGAKENNLNNVTLEVPIGTLTVVTGVSGSGKSSLVTDTLAPALANRVNHAHRRSGTYKKITGLDKIDKVINIDQSPIGRTPRSNPATYIGLWDDIRALFASTQESKARGYGPGRFSFNVNGGRCEACKGDGQIKIEMHFLPDVYVPCEVCNGERYNRETLQVTYRGKNISEVLDMTVEDALHFFENIPGIRRKLQTLFDVGLGYIRLGQPATTLSGGEAQRVKLASELQKRQSGKTFYILDEPTTGLHFEDVRQLLEVLQRLVDAGNTVLVIEHNLDVIKCADHIVDLGPEGGDRGGTIVAQGTPEEVAEVEGSYTGHFVKRMLEADRQLASR